MTNFYGRVPKSRFREFRDVDSKNQKPLLTSPMLCLSINECVVI